MKPILTTGGVLALTGLLLTGCYNDKYEELYGGGGGVNCDTTEVSYSAAIQPILNQHCALPNCHRTGDNPGGYTFDNYEGSKFARQKVIGAINHQAGYSAMPKNLPILPECERAKIGAWINQGAQNN